MRITGLEKSLEACNTERRNYSQQVGAELRSLGNETQSCREWSMKQFTAVADSIRHLQSSLTGQASEALENRLSTFALQLDEVTRRQVKSEYSYEGAIPKIQARQERCDVVV